MIRGLVTIGLFMMAISVLGLIVVDTEMGGDHTELLKKSLFAGAGACAAGLVLGLLGKLTSIRIGRRCPRCGHSVRHGHIYCEDHFQEALNRARDHMAGR